MLVNNSYHDPELKKKINDHLGKPFTLKERFKMGGIGSPKMKITDSSIQIRNLLILDNSTKTCNIELRPNGILLGFQVRLQTYLLVIPFYKLIIYKGSAEEYSIHVDQHYVKILARKHDTGIHKYFKKLLSYKADNQPDTIDKL